MAVMIFPSTDINIKKAAAIIREGGLVSFPTETVYGLGANALSQNAVAKIFAAKNRPSTNPLIVHIHSTSQIKALISAEISNRTLSQLEKLYSLWPGPLSVVLPCSKKIPSIVSANSNTVAIRIPNHPVALKLLEESNLPIAAPSANPSGYVSPTCAEHVEDLLGSKIDMILDGGACKVGIESTVISLVENAPVILRPGFVTKEILEKLLGEKVIEHSEHNLESQIPVISPGMSKEHYAPRTPLSFCDQFSNLISDNQKLGLIKFYSENKNPENLKFEKIVCLSPIGNSEEIAVKLFAALRELDKEGLDNILIDRIKEEGIGKAIMDRLYRATFKNS